MKYVEALIGADTVTTLPLETLNAYRDHGRPASTLLSVAAEAGLTWDELMTRLKAAGIAWTSVASQLEEDGVRKFIQPHEATLAALRKRIASIAA